MPKLYKEQEYNSFLSTIKKQIQRARVKAVIAVNNQLLQLYWEVGCEIIHRQENQKWGSKVIKRLSQDLRSSFPDLKGFSERNLLYMKQFARNYPDFVIAQPPVAQISWSHNTILLDKCKKKEEQLWYAQKAIENGWSRNIMLMQIETGLYNRKGAAITNFKKSLPDANSELVVQTIKDPYIFDFLNLTEEAKEKDIEKGLVDNIAQFLLELGKGFAFVGRQYHISVGKKDFYIDLLFYHIDLECYIVIELKAREFKPEYAGQLGFYLTAIDKKVKKDHHNPTIGLIICKERDKIVAEYALGHINNPVGISEFRLSEEMEIKIKNILPSIEELEKSLKSL